MSSEGQHAVDSEDELQDELETYLRERLRNPSFRRYYARAHRRDEQGHKPSVPVKPSLRRRGWRRL